MRLIYSFCFGEECYFKMAQEMIGSVRTHGFDGEILILADREWEFEGAETRVLHLEGERLWKSAILDAVRPEDYEKILYLDTDIICVKPIDWAFTYESVTVAVGSTLLYSSPGTSHQLSKDELQAAQTLNIRAINTGAMAFPGGLAREFLTHWEMAWKLRKRRGSLLWSKATKDQLTEEGVLQLLYFQQDVALDVMPHEKMMFPCLTAMPGYCGKAFSSRTGLLHFLSNSTKMHSKEAILEYMRRSRLPENIPDVMAELHERCRRLVASVNPREIADNAIGRLNGALKSIDERLATLEKALASEGQPIGEKVTQL